MSSGLVVALGLALLVDAAVRGRWDVVLQALGPIAVVVWAVWVLMVRPTVVVQPDRLTVTNPLRVVELPWGAVADVRMRYQIVVEADRHAQGDLLGRPDPAAPEARAARRAAGHADVRRSSPSSSTRGRSRATADWTAAR